MPVGLRMPPPHDAIARFYTASARSRRWALVFKAVIDSKRGLIAPRMMLLACPVRACLQAIVCPVKTCGVSWNIYTCLFIQSPALQVNRQVGRWTFSQKMYRHGPDVSTVLCGLHYIGRHREALVRCNFRVTRLLNCQGAARWQFGV